MFLLVKKQLMWMSILNKNKLVAGQWWGGNAK